MTNGLRRVMSPALALVAMMLAPGSATGDEQLWVGRRVMPKQTGIRIGHSDADGNQVHVAELTDFVYTVRKETEDGWLHLRHRNTDGWVWKGEMVLLEDAVDHFARQIRADRDNAFAWAHRGRAWQEEGEPERALRDLTEAIRLQAKNAAWFRARGAVYEELREYDRALRDLGDAIRLEPAEAGNYLRRGAVHKASRDFEKAIADYNDAIRLDSKSSTAFFNRGNAFKARKDLGKAIADYTDAIRLEPEFTAAMFNRANAHTARKQYADAARDYAEVLRLDAKDADACSNLAWLQATCPDGKLRDGKRAVENAAKACDLTAWRAPYFLAVLAAAHAESGNFEQAIQWQNKALESPAYERVEGDKARQRLKLFEQRKPLREE